MQPRLHFETVLVNGAPFALFEFKVQIYFDNFIVRALHTFVLFASLEGNAIHCYCPFHKCLIVC